jgi:hypothetical protein
MTPDESIEFLREAHNDPLPDAQFAAVRARVLAEIARPRPARRIWGWKLVRPWNLAAICTAAALVWILLVRPEHGPPHRPVSQPARTLASAAPLPGAAPTRLPRPHRVRRHTSGPPVQRAGLKPAPAEPLVVKLVTDDPNVVIYWISTSTGE